MPSTIDVAVVRRSQGALPVSVPRNITPVCAATSIPQSGPVRVSDPPFLVPFQPIVGSPTQREKPPLTTYDRFPWPGWTVRSSGQVRTPIDLPLMRTLLGEPAAGSAKVEA